MEHNNQDYKITRLQDLFPTPNFSQYKHDNVQVISQMKYIIVTYDCREIEIE